MRYLFVMILLAACSKHEDPPAPVATKSVRANPVTADGAPASPDAAGKGSDTGSSSGAGSGGAVVAMTSEQKAAAATFSAAMTRGRKATAAKTYPEAIAAFDDALKARPNEPHALAERGFAKLLAGTDLEAASADFDHAADGTHEAKLLGMIWFNRGLVDDKLGNAEQALVDYYLANQLQPTKTAAAKLAGKQVCPIRMATAKELVASAPLDAADWLALAKAMDVLDDLDQPKTSDAARKALLHEDGVPLLPIGLVSGGFGGKTAYVVGQLKGKLRAVTVASEPGGRCSGSVGVAVIGHQGDLVYARATESFSTMNFLCGDDHHDCKPDEEQTGTACSDGGAVVRDVVIDLATGHALVAAEQPLPRLPDGTRAPDDDRRLVQASLAADGLHLTGVGCDRIVPISKAP